MIIIYREQELISLLITSDPETSECSCFPLAMHCTFVNEKEHKVKGNYLKEEQVKND